MDGEEKRKKNETNILFLYHSVTPNVFSSTDIFHLFHYGQTKPSETVHSDCPKRKHSENSPQTERIQPKQRGHGENKRWIYSDKGKHVQTNNHGKRSCFRFTFFFFLFLTSSCSKSAFVYIYRWTKGKTKKTPSSLVKYWTKSEIHRNKLVSNNRWKSNATQTEKLFQRGERGREETERVKEKHSKVR